MIAEKDRAWAAMQLERVRNQVAEALMPMGANILTVIITQVLIGANPLLLIHKCHALYSSAQSCELAWRWPVCRNIWPRNLDFQLAAFSQQTRMKRVAIS
jgi:hypothetical protein